MSKHRRHRTGRWIKHRALSSDLGRKLSSVISVSTGRLKWLHQVVGWINSPPSSSVNATSALTCKIPRSFNISFALLPKYSRPRIYQRWPNGLQITFRFGTKSSRGFSRNWIRFESEHVECSRLRRIFNWNQVWDELRRFTCSQLCHLKLTSLTFNKVINQARLP
jgi:hypothetical protein